MYFSLLVYVTLTNEPYCKLFPVFVQVTHFAHRLLAPKIYRCTYKAIL